MFLNLRILTLLLECLNNVTNSLQLVLVYYFCH